MKKDKGFEDDGRQVADMSDTYRSGYGSFSSLRKGNEKSKKEISDKKAQQYQDPLTKRESRKLMFNALLAGLLIGTVFIVGALIFILFTLNIWLK